MKQNRLASFIILAFVYVIATIGGILLYNRLPFDYPVALLLADIFATIITFIFSLVFNNASVYDPYWSVQPIVIMGLYAYLFKLNTLGILLLVAICYWGLRLTANWAYTFKNLTCQDWRYTMLHEKTGKFYPIINFIGIHMVPTLVVYFCTLPAVVAVYEGALFRPLCIPFICLAFIAPTIQMIADIQMQKFRKKGTGGFIRTGLWKHARHPNYFGEILMWWGIGLTCVCAMPKMWYLLGGAFANTLLFCFVSIPMAEKRQSKKAGFEDYKKQTRILI